MSIPTRAEAARQLLRLDPPPWFLRHSRAVAEIAGWLALRIGDRGVPIDRALVETAALLHDVDKLLPPTDPASELPHGEGSAAWLERAGYPELAPAARWHPVTRLDGGPAFDAWRSDGSMEERVVAYADKRAGQHVELMEARFASWQRRYPDIDTPLRSAQPPGSARPAADRGPGGRSDPPTGAGWGAETARRVRQRADALEAEVCRAAGVAPHEVRRLRWTGPAFRAARLEAVTDAGAEHREPGRRRAAARRQARSIGA